jgi:hypothetical protein
MDNEFRSWYERKFMTKFKIFLEKCLNRSNNEEQDTFDIISWEKKADDSNIDFYKISSIVYMYDYNDNIQYFCRLFFLTFSNKYTKKQINITRYINDNDEEYIEISIGKEYIKSIIRTIKEYIA